MTAFVSLLVAVNAVCVLVDRFLLNIEREKIKQRISDLTKRLSGLNALNAPQRVLQVFGDTFERWFGTKYFKNYRFWIAISVLSISFTIFAHPVSNWLEGEADSPLSLLVEAGGAKALSLIAINLALDLLVWCGFLFFLVEAGWAENRLKTLKFVAVSLFVILIIAEKRYGVFFSVLKGWDMRNFYLGHRFFELENYPYIGVQMLGAFFPFMLFLLGSIVLTLLIPFVALSKWVAERIGRKVSETPAEKLAPFTLAGSFLTCVVAVIKFGMEIAK